MRSGQITRKELVQKGHQLLRTLPVGLVLGAEFVEEHVLLEADPPEEKRDHSPQHDEPQQARGEQRDASGDG